MFQHYCKEKLNKIIILLIPLKHKSFRNASEPKSLALEEKNRNFSLLFTFIFKNTYFKRFILRKKIEVEANMNIRRTRFSA